MLIQIMFLNAFAKMDLYKMDKVLLFHASNVHRTPSKIIKEYAFAKKIIIHKEMVKI